MKRVEKVVTADFQSKAVEVLWISPRCEEAKVQRRLFGTGGVEK